MPAKKPFLSSVLTLVLTLYRLMKWPQMTIKERWHMERILFSSGPLRHLEIFEYGSGYSTLCFAKFLRKRRMSFHIHSVDNNAHWHTAIEREIVRSHLDTNVSLYLCPFKPFWEKEGWDWKAVPSCGSFAPKTEEEFEYINMPLLLKQKFDIIIIDGRFRRRCLELAVATLKPQGVIFLHDAHREHYAIPPSLSPFGSRLASGRFYPLDLVDRKYWLGRLQETSALDEVQENLNDRKVNFKGENTL